MIWGPHLLLLVAIWRKQDTEMRAISFLPALDGQHMLYLPHRPVRPLFCSNCSCIWNIPLIGDIFLQLCFCGCFLEGGSNGNSQICILNKRCDLYSYGRTGRITHAHVCYQETRGEAERWKEGERGKINRCFSQEEKEDCALKIHSRVVLLQSIFGTRFPPRFTPNATLF